MTAEDCLNEIHQLLYPEEWMDDAGIEKGKQTGLLNADGIREWRGADDLEVIGEIVTEARGKGIIKRTTGNFPKGE